jgi:tetratricopeptide (TPR) repeat protein
LCNRPGQNDIGTQDAQSVATENIMVVSHNRTGARWHFLVAVGLLTISSTRAANDTPPAQTSNPEVRETAPVDSAPTEIREYLAAAKAADKIADPLARCLAFPDFPGNRWPKGLAEQTCQQVYGPRITRARIQTLLDAGQLAELDALYAADLAGHFVDSDFPERIHQDYDPFDASYESGKQSKVWLEKAPNSAFAMVARAEYFREMARTSRGGKYVKDTPSENLQRMNEFIDKAVDLYQAALKIEPRLVQAYSGMLHLGTLGSRPKLVALSIKRMNKIDPACRSMAHYRMLALEPRWGGSYEAMLDFGAELSPFVARRPILALDTVMPVLDKADALLRDKRWPELAAGLEAIVPLSTNPEIYQPLATAEGHVESTPPWKQLVHLVAESRYQVGSTWSNTMRGNRLLWYAHDAEWALPNLVRASKDDPDSTTVHYLLGKSYEVLNRYAEAEKEYLRATNDEQTMYDLTGVMLKAREFDKARQYSDRHLKEYPDDPWAWYQRFHVLIGSGVSQTELATLVAPMQKFLSMTAGTTDPRLLEPRTEIQSELSQIQAVLRTGHAKP